MNHTSPGPFKAFRSLWLPYTNQAVHLGMAAVLIFWLVNALFSLFFVAIDDAGEGVAFFCEATSFIIRSGEIDRFQDGNGWLYLLQSVSVVILWATFGVAIARCMAIRFCRDEFLGYSEALAFSGRRVSTALLYPVIVSACIGLLFGLNAAIGALMQIPFIGIIFYVFLPLAWFVSIVMLAVGLSGVFGSGLVAGAIAIEDRGTTDAWGKALNYIFTRPVQFIIYTVVLKVLLLDVVVRYGLTERVLHRWTGRSLSALVDSESFDRIRAFEGDLSAIEHVAAWIYKLLSMGTTLFIAGLVVSFAVGGFTAMFLIFRSEIDGIDTSDIEEVTDDPRPHEG